MKNTSARKAKPAKCTEHRQWRIEADTACGEKDNPNRHGVRDRQQNN
jgi:hypothetical protein